MVLGGFRSTQHQLVNIMKHKPKINTLWTRDNLKEGCIVHIIDIKYGSHFSNKNTLYVVFTIKYNGKITYGYSRRLDDWFKTSKPLKLNNP